MAFALVFATSVFIQRVQRLDDGRRTPPITLEARIEELAGALTKASRTITEIETEIMQRRSLADRLRQDAATAEALAQASRQQVEAVAQVLRAEIERDKDRGFWWDLAKNLAFTLLGWALGEGSGYLRRRWRDRVASLR